MYDPGYTVHGIANYMVQEIGGLQSPLSPASDSENTSVAAIRDKEEPTVDQLLESDRRMNLVYTNSKVPRHIDRGVGGRDFTRREERVVCR